MVTPIIRLVCKGRDLSSLLAESVKYADRIAGYHKTGELRLWPTRELEAARALVEACVGAPELETDR